MNRKINKTVIKEINESHKLIKEILCKQLTFLKKFLGEISLKLNDHW